jgi:hypothetical protein
VNVVNNSEKSKTKVKVKQTLKRKKRTPTLGNDEQEVYLRNESLSASIILAHKT